MNKKLLGAISLSLVLSAAVGCGGIGGGGTSTSTPNSSSNSENETVREEDTILDIKPVVKDGYLQLNVNQSNGLTTEGYGCQVDTHIFKEAYNNFYTEKDMQEWIARIDDMELQSIRTQIFPEWYERGNDNGDYNSFDKKSANVDFNSIEMQQMYRLLDICQERDIKVDLSFYGCNRIFESQNGKIKGSWLANSFQNNWITAPKLEDEKGNPFNGYEE